MKRFFVSAAVLAALFSLAACEARVGNTDFTFPRWVILSYVAYVAAVILIAHFYLLRCSFKCPKCGTVFRPRWYEISVWLHYGSARVVKCPVCHRRGFCEKERRRP